MLTTRQANLKNGELSIDPSCHRDGYNELWLEFAEA